MAKTVYVVRQFLNGYEGCRPTEFSSKDDAIEFIKILSRLDTTGVKQELRLYECTEIEY